MRRIALHALVSLAVAGCALSANPPDAPGGGAASGAIGASQPHPKIVITSPARASFLAPGPTTVTGQVTPVPGVPIGQVIVAGQPVSVDAGGTFHGTASLVDGLNVISASCTDAAGAPASTSEGVLAGTFKPLSQRVPEAAVIHISPALYPVIAKFTQIELLAQDWTSIVSHLNPIYKTDFLWIKVWINMNRVQVSDADVSVVAKQGALGITVEALKPNIDVDVTVDLGLGTIGPVQCVFTADSATVIADGTFLAQPDGRMTTAFANVTTDFPNFDLTVSNGFLDTIVRLFARDAIKGALEGWIQKALATDFPSYLDGKIALGLQPADPWMVLGKGLRTDVRAEAIGFGVDGISGSFAFTAGAPTPTARALAAPGSLVTTGVPPIASPNAGLFACADDDTLNRLAYAFWAAGVLDLTIDDAWLAQKNISPTAFPIQLNAGAFSQFLPELAGRVPDTTPVALRTTLGLPPVVRVTGAPDLAQIQAGEVGIEILIDRGNGPELLVRAVAQAVMGLNLAFDRPGLSISSLGQPQFDFDITDEPIVSFDDQRVETLLAVVLTPLIPHLLNHVATVPIPLLDRTTSVTATLFPDGPSREHISLQADIKP